MLIVDWRLPGMSGLDFVKQLRRRKVVNRLMELLMVTAALLAVGALVLVVLAVVSRGYKAISWDFFTQPPATGFLDSGGGISNAIVGTIFIVACATVFALPLGILIAIYTHEFAPARVRRFVSFALDLLNGMPSIWRSVEVNPAGPVQDQVPNTGWGPRLTVDPGATVAVAVLESAVPLFTR